MTIRRRLLLILLGPLSLLLALGIALDYSAAMAPLHAAFDQALVNETLAIAAQVRAGPDGSTEFRLPQQAIELLRTDKDDTVYYLVEGPYGEFLGGDSGLPTADDTRRNPALRDAEYAGQAVRIVSYRVELPLGQATVTVAETTHKRLHARQRMLATIVLSDLVQLVGILAMVWLGVRLGLRPLLSLRAQIDSRSARDLAPLDETDVPGEVRPLTRALNHLFATVRATAQGQLQFLANAAHQLRTPLAGLQTQIELLSQDPGAGELRDSLKGMLDGTRRLGHTANQLLALARAEPSAAVVADFREIDLREIAEQAVARNFETAVQRGIDLGVEAAAARVNGSTWLLRELLDNLVDNALSYAPAGSSVTIRSGMTDAQPARAFLEVEDDGPGIAPEQRARVVERFYRAPGTPGEGCGLGLAIVDEIARAHRASLSIDSGANRTGTRVRIVFPAPDD
jgi:two-component system, OmpR family, sensor histidine kinase TctE